MIPTTTPATTNPTTDHPPNALRGESAVVINGRQVVFCLTLGALADLATAFGTRNNGQLFARLQGEFTEIVNERGEKTVAASGPSMADLPAIVAALSNRSVSMDEARGLAIGEFQKIMTAVARAVVAAFPEPGEKKSAVAALPPITTETSPSTDTPDSPSPI